MNIEIDINDFSLITDEIWIYNISNGREIRRNIGEFAQYKVWVYSNEGLIPHFHIKNKCLPDCCLKICSNEYFRHGSHIGTLNKKELKTLYEWLSKDNKHNWIKIIKEWNKHINDNIIKISEDINIPDYININN